MLTAFGIIVGLFAWTAASVLGLAALIATSAMAFNVVKLAGAAYLVYLGIRTLLAIREPKQQPILQISIPTRNGSAFRQGLVSNLLNPKIAVLFTSLIPQFVSAGPAATTETLSFAGVFILLGLTWLTFYALVASAAAG